MSFFFSKQKQERPVKRGVSILKPAGSIAKETLNRLGCKVCPLDKMNNCTPKMLPDSDNQNIDIYIIGKGPSETDDRKGIPFSDKAGKLLHSLLGDDSNYTCDNVVRDYVSDKTAPSWVAMECCRGLVTKSIEHARPKLLLGLGIEALQWMLRSSDMIGLRGRVFAVQVGTHKCWFLPTYHPQDIIDGAYDDSRPLHSKLGHCLKFDVARAIRLANELPTPTIDTPQQARAGVQAFNGQTRTQLAPLLKLISEARKAPEKAIDLETSRLRPYAADSRLLTMATSFGNINFAFALDHPKTGWKPDELKAIKAAIRELLSDTTTLIAHNTPFEIEWLIFYFGKESIWHDSWECTMMQAHFLDERRGKRGGNDDQFQPNPYQALDFLVKQHFGIAYKSLFKLDRKNMAKADLDETLIYNGVDTKYTLRLYRDQSIRLQKMGLQVAYREARLRQPTVALMQSLGISTDRAETKRMQDRLGGEIEEIQKRITSYPEVKTFIKNRQVFNPASQPDVIRIFKEYLPFGKALLNEEGKETVDKSTLVKIDHPLAKDIEDFRNRSKLKSTYVDEFEYGKGSCIWPDGKIHPAFNTTFAETGRTSCTASWTPVVTMRGEIPICDVVIGDLVWTHKKRWKPVTRLWRKGWEVMLNIRLSNGAILTCTKNHLLLNGNGQWITAGKLYSLFQKMDKHPSKYSESFSFLPFKENVFRETGSSRVANARIQCVVDNQKSFIQGRVQSLEEIALLNVKVGRQEPNEGFNRQESPPMERRYRRRSRLQNHPPQWKTSILSPLCLLSGIKDPSEPSTGMGDSSHRRKSTQQRIKQPVLSDEQRASGHSHEAAAGFEITYIEEIKIGRSCEVFDITVSDDASYLTCGVISHNSDEPNQQNWPKRNDSWVRKQIVASPGNVLVAFDYGQLEACTAAMCTKDKVLVKALWEDYDIHMEWAIKAAHRHPASIGGLVNLKDKGVMKGFRSKIKNKLVFPAMFGASNGSVAGYLSMPIAPVDKLMSEFWGTFYGMHNWQRRTMNDYYDFGYVSSPTGRRRHYPLTKNQVVNYPIQSLGCDIVCCAMVTLSEYAATTGKWYLHPIMNIHDDLTFDIPNNPKILEEAIEKIYRVMLAPVYDFINVPLSVECSIGDNWLEMKEIEKFWSHKNL